MLSLRIKIFKTCMFIFFAFCTGILSCALLISVDLRHGMESSLYHWGQKGSFIKSWRACCRDFINGIVLYFWSQIDCYGSFQVNKKSPDLAAVGRSEGLVVAPADPLLRITQLEQNIRFLQDQHKLMLTSLHQEVEQLRQRNRGK